MGQWPSFLGHFVIRKSVVAQFWPSLAHLGPVLAQFCSKVGQDFSLE
nr:MAG TPA: hypothetical protein [Caudoviricetes sp.]